MLYMFNLHKFRIRICRNLGNSDHSIDTVSSTLPPSFIRNKSNYLGLITEYKQKIIIII